MRRRDLLVVRFVKDCSRAGMLARATRSGTPIADSGRDTLNRHWKTCKARLESGSSIPSFPAKTRGKKRKACDRCMKMKRACDGFQPCETCTAKGQDCHYTETYRSLSKKKEDLNEEPMALEDCDFNLSGMPFDTGVSAPSQICDFQLARRSPSPRFFDRGFARTISLSLPDQLTGTFMPRNRHRFEFLVFVANGTGLADSFGAKSATAGPMMTDAMTLKARHPAQYGGISDDLYRNGASDNPHVMPTWNSAFDTMLLSQSSQSSASPLDPSLHQWATHPLGFKAQEIVSKIKSAVLYKPRRSSIAFEWSPLMETMCFHFFSPHNIVRLLEEFWVSWYPHGPIIHKPTFNPAEASPLLLVSMILVGASFSPFQNDRQNGKTWVDVAEELIFDDELLQYEYDEIDQPKDDRYNNKKLEALQAAFFVCLFQNWEGTDRAMARLRRRRYSAVVSVSLIINEGVSY